MRVFAKRFTLATFIAVAGCSGHGGSLPAALPVATPIQAPTNAPTVQVRFRILVPAMSAASSSRRPQYVSASTKSASIAVTPGSTAPVVVNCTTVCQGQIAAPIGTDTFTVKLYDATAGTGNILSTGTMAATVVIDQNNTINLTFNGVVAAIAVVVNPATATYGTAQTSSVTVNALDADGNVIVAPGVYVDAGGTPVTITLANSDTSGHTTLSATQVTQPTTGITLAYDGNSYISPTISATTTGVAPGRGTLTVNCRPAAATAALYTDGFSDTGTQSLDRYPLTVSGNDVSPIASANLAIQSTAYATGLALDSAGTLYANTIVQVSASPAAYQLAVETWCADVTGSPPPRSAFIEQSTADGEIALDGAANVYGTSFNSSNMSFSVYELAAGSGGPATAVSTTSTPTPVIRSFPATPPIAFELYPSLAVDGPGNMYTGADSVIGEYAPGTSSNPTPTRTINSTSGTGLITPISTAVDPAGNVYVLYLNDMRTTFPGSYAIAEFAAANQTAPSRVIEGPATQIGTYLGNPAGTVNPAAVAIAVDPTGNLFLLDTADRQSGTQLFGEASITEFGPSQSGNVAPESTINLTTGVVSPNDLAVDASDNLYLSDSGSFVSGGSWYEYTSSGTLVRTLAGNAPDGSSDYENIAVDPSTGNVAVTNYDGAPSGNVYFFTSSQTGNAAPTKTIAVQNVLFVKQLGFDGSSNLYVLTAENQFNTVFISPFTLGVARRTGTPSESIFPGHPVASRPVTIPAAIARNRNHRPTRKPQFAFPPSEGGPTPPFSMVSVFASSASGAATPTRTFTDPFTFDSESDDMKVAASGTVYVSSRFGNAIYAYAPTASGGGASPTLAYWTFGPSTAFAHLGTDSAGTLYDVSGVSNAISVYATGATTPERTIVGPHTLLSSPGKPVIDSAGELFVLDFDLNAVLVFGPSQSGDVPPERMLSQTDVIDRVINQIAIGPGTVTETSARRAAAHRR